MRHHDPLSAMRRMVATLLLIALLWRLRQPALLAFGAVLLAASLHALAGLLAGWLRLTRRRALLAVLALGLLSLSAALWLAGGLVSLQLGELRQQLPEAWKSLQGWLMRQPFGPRLLALAAELSPAELPWANIADLASQALYGLGALLVILVMGVYLAFDVQRLRTGLVRLFPRPSRGIIGRTLDQVGEALTRWLLGQLMTMGLVGLSAAAGLALLGMPMALALGLIAGLLEFVPFFGPVVSAGLAVLVAFAQGPEQALYAALLFLGIQQLEGNLLVPLIQGWAVQLPPALAVGAVLVFGSLFGISGLVFGTPLMVVTMVLVQRLYVEHALEGGAS